MDKYSEPNNWIDVAYTIEQPYGGGTILKISSSDVGADLIDISDVYGNCVCLSLENVDQFIYILEAYKQHVIFQKSSTKDK